MKRWNSTRLRIAAICIGALASSCEPWKESPPPLGTYRITNLDEMRAGDALTAPLGKVAIFQVDYQGPREWAEIVCEHWRGPVLLSTDVLMRLKFGSQVIEHHDWGMNATTGPAFSRNTDRFSVWLTALGKPYPPGVNSFAYVKVMNPDEPKTAQIRSTQLDLPAHREGAGPDQESWRLGRNQSQEFADSESTLLWSKSAIESATISSDPAATAVKVESRILFRLVER